MEFIVIRNGELWTDGFRNEDEAKRHIHESVVEGFNGRFEVLEVTTEELEQYYQKIK